VAEGLKGGGQESVTLLPLLVVVFVLTGFVQVLLPRDLVANLEVAMYGGRLTGLRLLASLVLPPVAGLLAHGLGPLLVGRT